MKPALCQSGSCQSSKCDSKQWLKQKRATCRIGGIQVQVDCHTFTLAAHLFLLYSVHISAILPFKLVGLVFTACQAFIIEFLGSWLWTHWLMDAAIGSHFWTKVTILLIFPACLLCLLIISLKLEERSRQRKPLTRSQILNHHVNYKENSRPEALLDSCKES